MKRFALYVLVVFAILLTLVVAWRLFPILLTFLASLAFAAMLRLPIERLSERLPRALSVAIVYAIVLLGAFALLYFTYQRLGFELAAVSEDLSFLYARLVTTFNLGAYAPAVGSSFPTPEEMTDLLAGAQFSTVAWELVGITQGFANVAGQIGLIVILSIYWTVDRLRFERLALSLFPAAARTKARNIWRSIDEGLGAYLRSEVVQSLLAGFLLAPLFLALGIRYPVFWALAIALARLVPLVGALIVAVPLWTMTWIHSGPIIASAAVVATVAVMIFLELAVERRLFPRERGANVLLLIVLLVMADAYGLVGLLFAPPLAAAIDILLYELASPQATVTVRPALATGLDALAARLGEVRTLVDSAGDGNSRRLQNMVRRLEDLLKQARDVES